MAVCPLWLIWNTFDCFPFEAGKYAYVETTATTSGKKAVLLSPDVKGTASCISFWYHMFGDSVGSLRVFVMGKDRLKKYIWTKKGTKGDTWRNALVNIQKPGNFKVLYFPLPADIWGIKITNFNDCWVIVIGVCPLLPYSLRIRTHLSRSGTVSSK